MRVTCDDLAVTLFFCGVVPLIGLWLVLLLLPVYVNVAVWVLYLCGGV
jgi:hypothetical protein